MTPDQSPDAARVEQNIEGCVTEWNAEAERLFGWTRAEAIGMRSEALIPARNRERYERERHWLIASGRRDWISRDITVVRRDGSELHVALATRLETRRDTLCVVSLASLANPARIAIGAMNRSDRYRSILDQLEDGCSVIDLRGNFLFVNDAFCRMFNYEKDDVIGRNYRERIGASRAATIGDMYQQVYRTGRPVKAFEWQVFPAGRPPMWIEQSISLELDDQQRPIGFLAITRDTTARKDAEQALADAKAAADAARAQAEDANRAKSEFLANMSHEIRTPMNGIIGMCGLALDMELDAEPAECVATAKSCAESLLRILNDILDFSKIEGRKVELEAIPFDVAELIEQLLQPLAVRAREKGLALVVDMAPGAPRVIGDPTRLRQVVTNLVGNAIKFTHSGSIAVRVGLRQQRAGAVELHVAVSDTGIGIPEDRVGSIFEPFTQADSTTTRRFGGTGLGLTIASTLVAMMDGRMWVESAAGQGSTFHFTAVLGLAGEPFHPVEASAPPAAPPRPRRVLVVEDNVVNQRIAFALLQKRGHHVTVANDGREAVELTARTSYDVVLMDVQMPVMDGFEATREIRRREAANGARLRIVAMTAHAMDGDRERCLAAGMDGYLSKPIDPAALRAAVETGEPATDGRSSASGAIPAAASCVADRQ